MTPSLTLNIAALIHYREHNPHYFLGLHSTPEGQCIRLWRPGSGSIHLEVLGQIVEAVQVDAAGLFEYVCPKHLHPFDYRVFHSDGSLQFDPLCNGPIDRRDGYLFIPCRLSL